MAALSPGDVEPTSGNGEYAAIAAREELDSAIKTYPACWDYLTQCHGDSDNDGWVKGGDFLALKNSWYNCYSHPAYNPCADFNRDGCVDGADFLALKSNWYKAVDANCTPGDPHGIYPVMVQVPAGEFLMGDHFDDWKPGGSESEFPVHAVYLDSFYMGAYEITNAQYCDFLNREKSEGQIKIAVGIVYSSTDDSNSYPYSYTYARDWGSQIDYLDGLFSSRTKAGRDMSNDPVVLVTWYGAVAYCNRRSREEGYEECYDVSTWECDFLKHGYRLPTEAEWEYAGRGGQHDPYRRFPWGYTDTISHSQANYYSESKGEYTYDLGPTPGFNPAYNDGVYPYTAPVGSFEANGYGLYDMAGNIVEWCNDWYEEHYYDVSGYDNPTGPAATSYRVLRGGQWHSYGAFCRVARRSLGYPAGTDYGIGFRVVLDLE